MCFKFLIINIEAVCDSSVFLAGGCGAMFEVSIEAEEFRGLKTVKQHMLVNQVIHLLLYYAIDTNLI